MSIPSIVIALAIRDSLNAKRNYNIHLFAHHRIVSQTHNVLLSFLYERSFLLILKLMRSLSECESLKMIYDRVF